MVLPTPFKCRSKRLAWFLQAVMRLLQAATPRRRITRLKKPCSHIRFSKCSHIRANPCSLMQVNPSAICKSTHAGLCGPANAACKARCHIWSNGSAIQYADIFASDVLHGRRRSDSGNSAYHSATGHDCSAGHACSATGRLYPGAGNAKARHRPPHPAFNKRPE